ncbi:unnamed protein product [Linum tenue]|uniref:CASP-like protein n=1 Tax=Linum tenue TaxID=586396 RepID=A0AAV0PPF6_9ROSI|nr:unnamed protein product [Linum tenue]
MASQRQWTVVLVLRLSTLFILVASVLVLVFNTVKVPFDVRNLSLNEFNPTKLTFKDLIAFKYLLAVAIIGAVYTIVQLPLAIYHVATGKRLSRKECMPEFDFYGDKLVSYLLATAVGAGFLVCADLKVNLDKMLKTLEDANTAGLGDSRENYDKFFNMGFLATTLLFLAFVCMAVVSVLSSINRNHDRTRSIFG